MPPGLSPNGVTYQQMVDYVARVTDPMEDHMDAHDTWHRDQLTIAQRADRAARLSLASVWVAIGALIVTLVLGLAVHH